MDSAIKRRIIGAIKSDLSDRFRVIDNTGKNKQLVAGQFPEVLLMRQEPPKNDDILFAMKIEGGNLMDGATSWRELEQSDVSFYLVVPEDKLDEAKRLANLLGIFAKFASYALDHQEKVKIRYE